MTVTVSEIDRGSHFLRVQVAWTADGSGTIDIPDKPLRGIAFCSDGNDGGGTLTWFVSVDGTQFDTLGVNTSTDPNNPTAVLSATAAGTWAVHEHDLSNRQLKFTLASSTNPTLKVKVCFMW